MNLLLCASQTHRSVRFACPLRRGLALWALAGLLFSASAQAEQSGRLSLGAAYFNSSDNSWQSHGASLTLDWQQKWKPNSALQMGITLNWPLWSLPIDNADIALTGTIPDPEPSLQLQLGGLVYVDRSPIAAPFLVVTGVVDLQQAARLAEGPLAGSLAIGGALGLGVDFPMATSSSVLGLRLGYCILSPLRTSLGAANLQHSLSAGMRLGYDFL